MQESNQPYNSSPKSHWLRWSILAVVGIVVIAGATIGVLYLIKPVSTDSSIAKEEDQTVSADTTDTTSSATKTIATLASAISDNKIIGESPSVVVSEGNQTLYVSLTETLNYIDVKNDTALHLGELSLNEQQTTAAVSAITKQLTGNGYEVSTPKLPSVKALFTSKNSSCQVATYSGANENITAMIDVLCANADSYQSTVDSRLALLKDASVAQNSFSYTQTTTTTVDKQEAQLILTFSKDRSLSGAYIYGKTGESWQYVGNGAEGTPVAGTTTEKFIINADIKQGTKNAQYGKAVTLLVGGK